MTAFDMVALKSVTSAEPLDKKEIKLEAEEVWQLNLDVVKSHTGDVIRRQIVPVSEIGSSTHWFDERYVLYSKLRPYLNKVVLPDSLGVCTTELVPLLPDSTLLDRQYLAYYLRSARFVSWISDQTAGAKMPRVSKKAFWDHELPLPALPTQRHIANVLDQADQLRRQAKQMETELNQLAQSLFLEMFGDFRSLQKDDFIALYDCAEVISGITKGQKLDKHETITLPYLRVANVQDGYLKLDEIKEIELKKKGSERYLLETGDVLLTEGGDFDKLGRGAVWHGEITPCVHQNHVFRVRLDQTLYKPQFFEFFLQSPYAKSYFLRCAKQTTNLASINITQLKNLMLPPVSLEQQAAFENKLAIISTLKKELKSSSAHYEHLFQSLTQQAFNGQLKLPEHLREITAQQESHDHEQLCLSERMA